jgi:hypothetical protein
MNHFAPIRMPEGIHANVPEAVYHSDPAEEPSASAGILKKLYLESPEKAAFSHPRLNPEFQPAAPTDAMVAGTILHALVLGTPAPYRELSFDDFRTKEAKAAKEAAVASGFLPILTHKLADLTAVAENLRRRLAVEHAQILQAIDDPETLREATLIWREDGALCRCRFDVLPPARYGFTVDLKFTGLSAEPLEWSRKLAKDYLFQADLYPRAVKRLRGDRPEFKFLVCETEEPYAVSVHALAPSLAEVAERRVDTALSKWKHCRQFGTWPGYSTMTHYAEASPWLSADDDRRDINEQIAKEFA